MKIIYLSTMIVMVFNWHLWAMEAHFMEIKNSFPIDLVNVEPKYIQHEYMLPLEETLKSLHFHLLWKESKDKLIAVREDVKVEIDVMKKRISYHSHNNGEWIFKVGDIQVLAGEIYISEEILEEILGVEILANIDTKVVRMMELEEFTPVFQVHDEIPSDIVENMLGVSLPNVEMAEILALVEVSHVDFQGKIKVGCIVVEDTLAEEVCQIFKILYDMGFPIQSVLLIENFGGNDLASMRANNTSAFNYRVIAGTNTLSNHSDGRAIDINPLINPHVISGQANPSEGQEYVERSVTKEGMINKNDEVTKLFQGYGWTWGGDWKNPDYQHFEKK